MNTPLNCLICGATFNQYDLKQNIAALLAETRLFTPIENTSWPRSNSCRQWQNNWCAAKNA